MRRGSLQGLSLAVLAAAAALLAGAGAWTMVGALDALKAQSRVELAMSMQRQFDNDYKQDRADCARAFLYGSRKKKGLETAPYPYLMDFFDSLGYLVERQAVDEEMTRRSLGYALQGYFEATEKYLRLEQKRSPRRYAHVFTLAQRWREDGPRADLNQFFQEEFEFSSPPPPEEAPRF